MSGAFCPACGAPADAGANPSPSSSAAPFTRNVASALCYLLGFITGLLFLLWSPFNKDRTVRFHAFQSILLTVAWFAVNLAIGIVLPTFILMQMARIIQVAGLILWLWLMWKAYSNEKIVLPVIGPIAEKQA